jgi:hypothetical protein
MRLAIRNSLTTAVAPASADRRMRMTSMGSVICAMLAPAFEVASLAKFGVRAQKKQIRALTPVLPTLP